MHQSPEARRYEFDTNAFPRFALYLDTSQPLPRGIELGKVTAVGEPGVYDAFVGAGEVTDNDIDRVDEADHLGPRRWLQLAYRRGLSNLNDSTACEASVPCRG